MVNFAMLAKSTKTFKVLLISFCCLTCALFLSGNICVACQPVTARKTKNWPSVYKKSWNISTIKKKDIKTVATINMPSGYYVQGGTVTEDYYVFGVFRSDSSRNYIYLVKRSTGKVVDKSGGYWGHMNSLYYKWGTNHVRVRRGSRSNDVCFDISKGKLKQIKNSKCKTKRAPDYGTKELITQGGSTSGGYVYVAGWDARCHKYGYRQDYSYARHATGLFIFDKSSKKLKKTLYIPNSVVYSEVEDVAIDGNSGDMYVLYNRDHKKSVYYRIKQSVVGLATTDGDKSGSSGTKSSKGDSGKSSSGDSSASSGGEQPVEIQIAPEHEQQCATILSFWCGEAETDGEGTVTNIISFIIGVMTIGIAVLGTVGIIWAGVTIMSARDDAAQVQKAKRRILEIVIGLVLWVLAAAIVALFLPKNDGVVEEALVEVSSEVKAD